MSNSAIIVNTSKNTPKAAKANGITGKDNTCVHTVKAEDLRIMRPIPGQGGLSMVVKLEG
jgi:hypothetical protein